MNHTVLLNGANLLANWGDVLWKKSRLAMLVPVTAKSGEIKFNPTGFIKDPYVLEFLELNPFNALFSKRTGKGCSESFAGFFT